MIKLLQFIGFLLFGALYIHGQGATKDAVLPCALLAIVTVYILTCLISRASGFCRRRKPPMSKDEQ
jgi:hypothetical protein